MIGGASVKRHTDREYEAELQQVRDNLLLMAGHVDKMIAASVKALVAGDHSLATETIYTDRRVNRLEIDTDTLCLLILAKRQPLATDLRFITLAMKMVTDLERIGDLAVNVCERALELDAVRIPTFAERFERMSRLVQSMVRDSIDAFIERDADKAADVCERDQEVDDLYLQVCNEIQEAIVGDAASVERGMHYQAVAKFVERIGDHATNLSELVIFLVKGRDIRHTDKLEVPEDFQ